MPGWCVSIRPRPKQVMSASLATVILLALLAWRPVLSDTKHAYRAENNVESHETTTKECVKESDSQTCGKHTEGPNSENEYESNDTEQVLSEAVLSHQDDPSKPEWDPKGYVMFCPCMGRLGNQAEHYLGALAFAKALDRTLVLPPFRTFSHASFSELFDVKPIREFHRVILMEEFMEQLAPTYWPPGKRIGYAHLPEKSEMSCNLKNGNPFGPFWDHFNIDFDDCIKYQIHNSADIADENSMQQTKQVWQARFPPEMHPVLALRGSPGNYPMLPGNRVIQKYLQWSPTFFEKAGKYIKETFMGEKYVGIHLRNGIDWERACEHADGVRRFMASPQCLESTPEVMVSRELCLPSPSLIFQQTLAIFEKIQAKHLYIATDKEPHLAAFKELLQPIGVSVHYLKPSLAEMDLMILGKADHFIGNCVSSFTSFVKRERDANGRPSSFWTQLD